VRQPSLLRCWEYWSIGGPPATAERGHWALYSGVCSLTPCPRGEHKWELLFGFSTGGNRSCSARYSTIMGLLRKSRRLELGLWQAEFRRPQRLQLFSLLLTLG